MGADHRSSKSAATRNTNTLYKGERKHLKDTDDIIEGTLSITKEDLGPLLDKRLGDPKCPCGGGVFSVASENNEFPSILKMADVREEGAEQWFYWLVCKACFQVKFVSAASCWQELRKGVATN